MNMIPQLNTRLAILEREEELRRNASHYPPQADRAALPAQKWGRPALTRLVEWLRGGKPARRIERVAHS